MSKTTVNDSNTFRYLQLSEFQSGNEDSAKYVYNLNAADDEKDSSNQTTPNEHSFNIRFFHKPILCFHCLGKLNSLILSKKMERLRYRS